VKVGEVLEGRYRIIKVLDEGAMGTVFLAEHVLIQRRVAIKIPHPELATDADVIERFMNEARAAGTLGHPNIVESTDMGFTRNDVPFIVFEFLEGTLLTDEIYRTKGLTVRRALRIGTQIASALHAAHTAGIVHRDLKSDNVFLTDKEDAADHVKVLDFGISRFLEVEDSPTAPGRQTLMGTPEFMAPEQVTSPESVDARTDVYAFGVVLYEMLAARRPFALDNSNPATRDKAPDVDTVHALLERIVNEPPPPLERHDAPPGLQEMIYDKLLAKDPASRYQSMKDVQGALEAFMGVARPSRDSEPIPMQFGATRAAPEADPARNAKLPQATMAVSLPPPKRRSPIGLLVAGIAAGIVGAGLMFADSGTSGSTTSDQAARTALDGAAEKIGALLDSEARAAHLRAEGIAQTPMLRAGIETDAATLEDMAGSDFLITLKKNEVLEVFQLRDGKTSSMLRIPEAASPLGPITGSEGRVQTDGSSITIVVSTPITKQGSGIGGTLAISVAPDLTAIKKRVGEHALQASLLGLAQPVVLAGTATPAVGTTIKVPISTGSDVKTGELSLVAVIAAVPTADAPRFRTLQYAVWGLGAILLLMYLVGLLRSGSQR
jgi:serine/threonine protein kinase